jgi:hypothetical protein
MMLGKWPTWRTIPSLYVYFSSLHASSNLVLIIRRFNCINTTSDIPLCVGDRLVCGLGPHSRRSPTQSNIPEVVLIRFSWWWARGCSKHVEKWNKHKEKNSVSSWSFTRVSTINLCFKHLTNCSFLAAWHCRLLCSSHNLYRYLDVALACCQFSLFFVKN